MELLNWRLGVSDRKPSCDFFHTSRQWDRPLMSELLLRLLFRITYLLGAFESGIVMAHISAVSWSLRIFAKPFWCGVHMRIRVFSLFPFLLVSVFLLAQAAAPATTTDPKFVWEYDTGG